MKYHSIVLPHLFFFLKKMTNPKLNNNFCQLCWEKYKFIFPLCILEKNIEFLFRTATKRTPDILVFFFFFNTSHQISHVFPHHFMVQWKIEKKKNNKLFKIKKINTQATITIKIQKRNHMTKLFKKKKQKTTSVKKMSCFPISYIKMLVKH